MKKIAKLLSVLFLANNIYAQKILSLEDALSIALKESYSIKYAEYSLESSQKNLEAVKLGLRTSVDMEFDLPRYSRSLSSQFNPLTGNEEFFKIGNTTLESRLYFTQPIVFTNGTFSLVGSIFGRDQLGREANDYYSNLSLRLKQPLFTFNTLGASLQRAEINMQKSERNYSKTQQEIIYNVTAAFYQLYQTMKNVEIAEEKVKQTNLSYETAINKFKAGLIAEVEALQLEVDLSASKNELLNALTKFSESKNNFKILIGLPLEEDFNITASVVYNPIEVDLNEAIEYALKNRPELKNSDADITLNRLNVDEVDSKGNINAMINANYGINKNDDRFKDIFSSFAEDRSITFTLSVPVWHWGKNSREVESAEANLKMAQLNFNNEKEEIKKEIITVVNKLKSAKARVEVLSKSVELAQKSYDISLSRFQAGTITSFDLSQMQLRLTDAKINSLNALIDYQLALTDLTRKTYHKY